MDRGERSEIQCFNGCFIASVAYRCARRVTLRQLNFINTLFAKIRAHSCSIRVLKEESHPLQAGWLSSKTSCVRI